MTPQGLLCPLCFNTGRLQSAPAPAASGAAAPKSNTKLIVTVVVAVLAIPILITIVLAATVFVLVSDVGDAPTFARDGTPSHAGFDLATINEGEFHAYEYCTSTSGGASVLEVEASVYKGPRMDVFVLTTENFALYSDGQPFATHAGTALNVFDYDRSLSFAADGACYRVVFDHTSKGGAAPVNDSVNTPILLEHQERPA